MYAKTLLLLLPVLAQGLALPVEGTTEPLDLDITTSDLVTRQGKNTGKTAADAKDFVVKCAGFEVNCEMNAAAILCGGRSRTLQRLPDGETSRGHYTDSGAALTPFNNEGVKKYGVNRISDKHISAEEYPWESTNVPNEKDREVWLMGVPGSAQSSQGGKINGEYTKQKIAKGEWFYISKFEGCTGTYCTALTKGDTSVCKKKTNPAPDALNYVWKKTSAKNSRPATFAKAYTK